MPPAWHEPEEWKKEGSIISSVTTLKTGAWTSMLSGKESHAGKGEIDVVIKTFCVPEEIVSDPQRVATEREKFITAARLQKELSDSKCAAWVDVYRISDNPPSFTMKKYGPSLQDMLDNHAFISANELYVITLSVLQGFAELFERKKRSHGSLKASDVLSAPGEHPPYQLADPSPKGEDHSANDLYALGLILFQLIEHHEWDPLTPIIPTKNWARFGSKRDRWITFLNMLLSPNGCHESLASVRREAMRLKPVSGARRAVLAAASLVVIAGAGAVAWYFLPRRAAGPASGPVVVSGGAIDEQTKAAWQAAHDRYNAVSDKWINRERTDRYDHAASTELARAARGLITDVPLTNNEAYTRSAEAYVKATMKLEEALAKYGEEDKAGGASDQAALADFNAAQQEFSTAKAAWDAAAAGFKPGHDHTRSTAMVQAMQAVPASAPADAAGRHAGAVELRAAAKRYDEAVALAQEETIAGTSVEQAQANFQEARKRFQTARDKWETASAGVTFDISAAKALADQARAALPEQFVVSNTVASYQSAADLYQAAAAKEEQALAMLEKLRQGNVQQESDVSTAITRANEALQKNDDAGALAWYRKAADLGNAAAMFNVGLFYETGRGTDKNETEAAKWYQKASDLKQTAAMVSLGMLYEKGHGVGKDVNKAIGLYKQAADLKDPLAMRNIAYLYENGIGVDRDEGEALRWNEKAAALNDPTAMFLVGAFHEAGKGVPIDYGEAMRWYQRAADLKNARAMNALGVLCETGHGTKQDLGKAMEWYKKAAELNYAPAMSNVGALYDSGIGVPLDHAEAFKWFKKGAEMGHAMSMYNLAVLYETGRGTAVDINEALKWYRKVAASDDEQAKRQAVDRLDAMGFSH